MRNSLIHDLVIRHISTLLTMDPTLGDGPLGERHDAAIAIKNGKIAWVGDDENAPEGTQIIDGSGYVVMPGLIDCHTHAAWAGSRSDEFRARLLGTPYTKILEDGGGILSTVDATREADLETLTKLTRARLKHALSLGVTTMEVKSGYGLDVDTECLQLEAIKKAADQTGIGIMRTFLGAHAIPRDYRAHREDYVRQVIEEQLPKAASHADFADAYIDKGAFTVEEGRDILSAAKALGLKIRVHAEQVTYTGAAAMAAELGATSADHLEHIDPAGIQAMKSAGTVGVLLPGAMLYLGDTPPPVSAMRDAGLPMAVATDLNPGSSPVSDLWTCATLSCLQMGLTIEEALLGITLNAARALGRTDIGRIGIDTQADIILVEPPIGEPPEPATLLQHMGHHHIPHIIKDGRPIPPLSAGE